MDGSDATGERHDTGSWRGGRARRLRSHRGGLAALALLLMTACSREARVPEEELQARARALGDSVASALATSLVERLREALTEGGAEHAIGFCSAEAPALTGGVAAGFGGGVTVKRTTSRPRNPANAPDSLERVALDHFEARAARGEALPTHYTQALGDSAYRYYRPLVISDFCTTCHGVPGELEPGVRGALAERYPGDRAVGYRPGDFRGLIRVEIARARLR